MMEKMVEVTAEKPHANDYGAQREKKKGDTYSVPEGAVSSLVTGGWVKKPAKDAAATA